MSIFNLGSVTEKCSRAGCQEKASSTLVWANPKIHRDGRTKTWLSCPLHLEYLKSFLKDRSFLLSEGVF